MTNLPIAYALGIFLLGFLAGVITAGMVSELGRKPGQEKQPAVRIQEANPAQAQTEQGGASLTSAPAAGSRVEGDGTGSAFQPSTTAEGSSPPQESVQWVPGPVEPRLEKVSANPIEAFVRSVQSSTTKEPPKQTSMADEIDGILQEMLGQSELKGRTIRLRSLPDQSVAVIVDGVHFNGVGEVTDAAARGLIQRAVETWQRDARPRDNL
jgi:hypothetical protein